MKENSKIMKLSNKKFLVAAISLLLIGVLIFIGYNARAGRKEKQSISLEDGIAIALEHSGYTQEKVTGLTGFFDKEENLNLYEISFKVNGYEYEYAINTYNGDIVEVQIETPDGNHVSMDDTNDIGMDRAVSIALQDAGFSKQVVQFTESQREFEDGKLIYSIDFIKDSVKYEFDIDGNNGEILDYAEKSIHDVDPNANVDATTPAFIGVDRAKSIAIEHLDLDASLVTFTKAKLDDDDGYHLYEIEFYSNQGEYEFEIDAKTGNVLNWEMD